MVLMKYVNTIMALVAVRGFHRNFVTGKSLSFVRQHHDQRGSIVRNVFISGLLIAGSLTLLLSHCESSG